MSGQTYRLAMRLLHRLDLCWMRPRPWCPGDDTQWIKLRCDWCGVRGRRLSDDTQLLKIAPVSHHASDQTPEASA